MKKRIFCFIIAILLAIFAAGTVFAADSQDDDDDTGSGEGAPVENGVSGQNTGGSGSGSSPQLALAMLQMELAQTNKDMAISSIKEIEAIQAEKYKVSEFLNTARGLREEAKSTGKETQMPSDMAEYMQANGLAYDTRGNDLLMTSSEWDTAINSLKYYLDNLGNNIQQKMLGLQAFMEMYNSYMQGANTAISQQNQVLAGLASGQSMYGDSEVGLAVTGLVVGLVLGCLITLAVQRSRARKDNA